ncbi:MAG: DJ-1/PfpI family protein [Deltaproteobacteria bacterium]|nr:DJ-1/PfpI family protein [Deltaproteobacteria bacterium]
MRRSRGLDRVIVVTFDGALSLDVFGPGEVFSTAARQLGVPPAVVFASSRGGPIALTTPTTVATVPLASTRPGPRDTVIVAGGEEAGVRAAASDPVLLRFLQRAAGRARRVASVCSGAFILGAAGLLEGRRCATHWAACDRLAELVPGCAVDRDAIFVRDGSIWTSAGASTGIDMSLAMVEEDLGRAVADGVAARLVLYVRRPGFQSQFSDALVAQQAASDPLGPALGWARQHLQEVDVERLAQRAGLSVRTLHRRTEAHLGLTPAKLIEKLRVEAARTLLASTELAQKEVAWRCGFRDTARMQRALKRALGMDGRTVRVLFTPGPSGPVRTSGRTAAGSR